MVIKIIGLGIIAVFAIWLWYQGIKFLIKSFIDLYREYKYDNSLE